MLYPKNLEQKLGFDQIREWIKQECSGTLGKAFVEKMRFSNDYDMIDKLVRQTAEMKTIMLLHVDEFPSSNFIDAVPHLAKAAIEGMFLTEEEFFEIKLSLRTIYDCLIFFKNQEENVFPQLKELTQAIDIDSTLLKDIDRVIDQRGKLRDDASPELQTIRRQIIAEQANLRKKLESILKQSISQGYTSDDASATIRNGRMVIPVAAEHKRKIKGFIQDESATGQTIYLEPVEIFDLNNEITELGYREKREIIRILTHLTDRLRPHVPNLKKAYTFLGLIDFIRAKAKFALRTQANLPIFSKKTILIWENTRHPLLYLSFQKQGKSVIPLSIKLEEKQRILVISGPNAGGKSIALKTVGLTQYMFQCGLLVCMDDHSQIGLFRDIFIDIGDEQSLENDLSTYSSHLTNMKYFLQHADKNTLFLIDEFGTGTEPGMGGAIAETILDALQQKKAFGVLNTHYGNLKAYANRTEGVANAAMRFDAEHLEPLYQLEIGRPGSSFAFEIAQKIGLPREIVTKSKQKVGTTQVDFDKMLRELETEKQKFAEQNRELQAKEKTLNETLAKYSTLKNELETGRKQLLNKAKEDARRLVKDANQKIETTIREIREVKAEKDLTKMLRQDLADFEKKLKPEDVVVELEPAPEIKVIGGTIEEGDLVRIKGQNTVGEVLSIKGKDAEIRIGELKSNVKINRLEKISRKEYRQQTVENQPRMQGIDMNEKMANFSTQLDLRGKRGEEALTEVDAWIDQGIMLGSSELRIVHGKGDGILRNLIRNHLRRYREIASMNDEHADRGGSGVTIIKMK
ncbi:endonuclease MutS2 [Cytophagaceae bacterium YF14B1]|uniref:Endonuclease MutS2 n=1 Tax=Xanthocytophaga flava TaxID=3048013 RepID=A0AAE3QST1_9BACT|nr:endonuclease MutS2 [Xanthocytophaga flavus]MDJ1484695.1 endonuclease MutS2 [Xanthocytophaga flavus]